VNIPITRRGEMVRCPWHGWEFDIKTGQSWFDPDKTRVRNYPVTVEQLAPTSVEPPASGLEPGPYMAETYPVTVENRVEDSPENSTESPIEKAYVVIKI